ncbi:hypothetical protein SCHPADRAFT_946412 [Schizopora paradoxa]|uniref:F-box domain-containing protein n=1 Tax=Schizopora paradoxa TaxID=27342 RepID=A0A0H2R2N3_9AGAM|nr:hypothetical protein SCHPADRAFT_946412 [Schizopora paradoxa]
MSSVANLPDEILGDVISLAIKNWRVFPDIFKTENDFKDCVALIDISQVCRRWREVAMTDPALWSSLYIHLQRPSTELLRQVAYFAGVCLARSQEIPLTCAITISSLFDIGRVQPLILALVAHEARWSRIAINFTPRSPYSMSNIPRPGIIANMSVDNIVYLKTAGADHLKG